MIVRPLADVELEVVDAHLPLHRLDQGDGFYLVARHGEEPVGHVHFALTDPPELQDMWVALGHRRSGVATALTRAAERAAAFYREQLGFELQFRWPAEGRLEFVFLRLEPLGIGLAARGHAAPVSRGRRGLVRPPRRECRPAGCPRPATPARG